MARIRSPTIFEIALTCYFITWKAHFISMWQISKPGWKVLNKQLQHIKIFTPIYTFLKHLLQEHSNWHISKRNPEKVHSIHLNRANTLHLAPKNKSRKWVTKNQSYSIYQKRAYILKNDYNLHSWFIITNIPIFCASDFIPTVTFFNSLHVLTFCNIK